MTNQKIIAWEHIDFSPTAEDEDEIVEYDEETDTYEDNNPISAFGKKLQSLPKIISTPNGLYRLDDPLNPFAHGQFWVGKTNFAMSVDMGETICEIDGVEIFKPLTRYRFLLGVADLFDFRDVRTEIDRLILNKAPNNALEDLIDMFPPEKFDEIVAAVETIKTAPNWYMCVLPNGEMVYGSADTPAELANDLAVARELEKITGGFLLKS